MDGLRRYDIDILEHFVQIIHKKIPRMSLLLLAL
jgi:hypothetical protein